MENQKDNNDLYNPALSPFEIMIGEWKTEGTHPKLPGTILHGISTFEWIVDGAFLLMRSRGSEEKIPEGYAIFGSDNTKGEYVMLYYDERQVSRKYEVSFKNGILEWWRDAPEFSQHYTYTFSADGNTMIAKGKIAMDGKTWEADLDLTYTRIQ